MKIGSHILVLLLLCTFSCTKKEIPASDSLLGLEYYPVTEGKFVIYNVDSVVYTDLPRDTVIYSYQIKEKIADTFIDNEGKTAHRIERYIRKYNPKLSYDSIPWTMKEVFMLNATDKYIQILENNIRFTKLIFPIQEFASWNGNAGNTLPERAYSYAYVDRSETVGNQILSNVLKVQQLQYITLISHQNYEEKYAKGIGLVYKEISDVLSNSIDPTKPVLDRIESGIIYKQSLQSYGFE